MEKRAVIYARISVSSEQSISIDRQLAACRSLANARGWTVVGEYVDDGVSASHKRPEERPGWRKVLAHPEPFERVLIWKVDRLARRALDFLQVHEALQRRQAAVVAVEDPIDMSSAQGRAMATILAVFGEMEAEAIRARVVAARDALISAGRVVGGTIPYGWCSVPNTNGAGFVLAQDTERIEYVRQMARQALEGKTVYAIQQWANQHAPVPATGKAARKTSTWSYATIERLLRNPVLAGMTPYQPGRGRHDPADPTAVLRDKTGMPVINEAVAILTPAERRALLDTLDGRDTPQVRSRASRNATSPLLSRLVTCGHCNRLMHRGTVQKRPMLTCPQCGQVISRPRLDPYIIDRLLSERGHLRIWESKLSGEHTDLTALEQAIEDITVQMRADDADVATLAGVLGDLKAKRRRARSQRRRMWQMSANTVQEAWEDAGDDEQRRAVLASQVASITVTRGKTGRYLDPQRVHIKWMPEPTFEAPDGAAFTKEVDPEGVGRIGSILVMHSDKDGLYIGT